MYKRFPMRNTKQKIPNVVEEVIAEPCLDMVIYDIARDVAVPEDESEAQPDDEADVFMHESIPSPSIQSPIPQSPTVDIPEQPKESSLKAVSEKCVVDIASDDSKD